MPAAKLIRAPGRQIVIRVAVRIVVRGGHTHSTRRPKGTAGLGRTSEYLAIIAIEPIIVVASSINHIAAVEQIEVLVASASSGEKSANSAIGLGQLFCGRGPVFVDMVDTYLPRDLGEADLTHHRQRCQQ